MNQQERDAEREKHRRYGESGSFCMRCTMDGGTWARVHHPWPCPTIRALDDADRLHKWLTEARELIESWGAYASDYFQEKWGLQDDLMMIDEALKGKSFRNGETS